MLLGGFLTSNVNKLMLLVNSNRCLWRQFTLIQHSRVCCVGRFVSVYSSTILSPNSCWNIVGNFVCNNTYWKTTAEILTHDVLVYGIHHWRKSQVIGSLQNGLTTTWGVAFQLPSRCEWVWGWFCHPHSQMKISKDRWTWWNCEFLWVWIWQNLKVKANGYIKHAASKFCNGGSRFSNGSIYVQMIYFPKKITCISGTKRMNKMMGAIAGQMSGVFRTTKSLFFKIVLFWKSVVQGSPQNHGWQLCRMPDVFAKALEPSLVLHRSKVADDSSCFTQKGIAECFVGQKDWVLSIRNWSNHMKPKTVFSSSLLDRSEWPIQTQCLRKGHARSSVWIFATECHAMPPRNRIDSSFVHQFNL